MESIFGLGLAPPIPDPPTPCLAGQGTLSYFLFFGIQVTAGNQIEKR
jgi:hypothetical protein